MNHPITLSREEAVALLRELPRPILAAMLVIQRAEEAAAQLARPEWANGLELPEQALTRLDESLRPVREELERTRPTRTHFAQILAHVEDALDGADKRTVDPLTSQLSDQLSGPEASLEPR